MATPTADVINNPSIQADAIRVCRLASDGTPVASSATGAYANYAFTKVEAKLQIETANEFVQRSADGNLFIVYRDDDRPKWYELTLTVQYPDACLMELMENGALLLGAGSIILGYEVPHLATNTNANPVSLEVWSKAPVSGGVQTGATQWYRWLFPLTRGWHRTDNTFENAPAEFVLMGYAIENSNFSKGSFHDWTTDETSAGTALDSSRCLEWIASGLVSSLTLAPGYLATPA